jgi:hypothetical protein
LGIWGLGLISRVHETISFADKVSHAGLPVSDLPGVLALRQQAEAAGLGVGDLAVVFDRRIEGAVLHPGFGGAAFAQAAQEAARAALQVGGVGGFERPRRPEARRGPAPAPAGGVQAEGRVAQQHAALDAPVGVDAEGMPGPAAEELVARSGG